MAEIARVLIKRMKFGLPLILLVFIFLSGCLPARVVQYTAFHDREFSERQKPATVQAKPADELLRGGYLLIGYIDLRRNIRSCYEDNQCVNHSEPLPSTEDIQREAAQRGGDVLTLLEDRTIIEQHNKSVCTSFSTSTTMVNNVPVVTTYCSAYRTIPGKREARISRALIWRHDPAAAGSEANARAIEAAFKAIESSYSSDKSTPLGLGQSGPAAPAPGSTAAAPVSFDALDELSRQVLVAIRGNNAPLLYSLARDGRLQKWTDDKGRTALMVSITVGQTDAANTLLAIDRGLNRRDKNGLSALHYAVARAEPAFVQKMVAAGHDPRQASDQKVPLVFFAIWNPKPDNFEWLLTQGLDPRQTTDQGHTTLMAAAGAGNEAMARRLLGLGVAINQADNNGLTALMHAAASTKPDVLKLLLEKGANNNVRDAKGNTVLHHAALAGQNESIRLLLKKGMDVNASNEKGGSPLVMAYAAAKWETAEYLLQHGAKLVSGPITAEDAAQYLISKNQPKLLQRYLAAYPPLRELVQRDPRWLQYAAKVSGRETIRYMVEQGARMDRPGTDGQTPLHTAAGAGNDVAVRALLELKANPAVRETKTGQTALRKATMGGHARVVETLREFGVRE